ncbi:MAG: TAXI family TRAP transporter solute-binding subunit [Rickettsia endosymbiont of Bryobia graminum]|nr:TAXI family TRAP transporter solute-binding subunit [Rickettsia endosymbiont of Bryobia graminum]
MNNLKILFVFVYILLVSSFVFAEQKIIKIGSGSIMKGYYSIGLDICKTFTASNKDIICEVVPTSGGIKNLNLLKEGKIDLALVQSNIALEAYEGRGYYSKIGKMEEVRQVLNLYDEFFTVIVKDDDKIKIFSDIEGKKISLLPTFSSNNITYQSVRNLYKFSKEPVYVDEINYEESAQEFCNGDIDAVIMTIGHPNPLVGLIANKCEIDFVPIESDKIEKLILSNKAFHKTTLGKGLYPGITTDQQIVAVSAILVTNNDMDSKLLDKFIGTFHNTVKDFKHSNYMLNNIDIDHFADINNFVIPKHISVRSR